MSSPGVGVRTLMDRRVSGLFRHDGLGRMVALNQWDGGAPPRFCLGRTRRGNVCRVRADVPERTARALLRLSAAEPPLGDPKHPPVQEDELLALLSDDGAAGAAATSGPVYCFEDLPVMSAPIVLIGGANSHLLRGGLDQWLPDVPHRQPMAAVVKNGRAVSLCASVRITDGSHEAGVETLPDHQRRGHAVSAAAGWAAEVRRWGIPCCFYSTSWDNPASQGVADRLGLALIGADFQIA